MRFSVILLSLLLVNCSDSVPTYVYVPGDNVAEKITISASTMKVTTNTPIVLHASRSTNGYVKVKYAEVPKDVCWWEMQPPKFEKEVADNLRWYVTPDSSMQFIKREYKVEQTRRVEFTKPGVYSLYAESAVWCPPNTLSNTIKIVVTGK
jgi:hypothetical protein